MRETIKDAAGAWHHLLVGAGIALLGYLMAGVVVFTAFLTLTVLGAGVLPETVLLLRRIASWERRRTAALTGTAVPEAYAPLEGPLPARVRTALDDPGTRRDLLWLAAHSVYGMVLWCVSLPLWVVAPLVDGVWSGLAGRAPVALPLFRRLAALEADWARTLLTPAPSAARDAALAARIEQLTTTRAGAVAAHGAELRRIERDLHDGAQARLVALSMRIGLARRAYDTDPATARKLLDDAQDQAEQALAELRHVVRGIHPPILTDRGLAGAVRALAAGSALDVTVAVDGLEGPVPGAAAGTAADAPRAPAAVEAAAYFAVAEALTNAAKHSGADRAAVELARTRGGVRVVVRDEGRGGARDAGDPGTAAGTGGGSGLTGMRRRVAALDGTVRLTSPAGGPTVIEVELPCVW
ncbi:sensor histidine kinase [Streptomyces sp. NPDC058955]|uniref:sensor histidine kinase n=1 Tax=Streptomyces sp. NPDC058955 TaxID=3346678 RepID=UPI003699BC92